MTRLPSNPSSWPKRRPEPPLGRSSLLQPPPVATAFLNPCSCSRRAEFKNGLRTSSPNKNRGDALGICAKGLATISDSLSLSVRPRHPRGAAGRRGVPKISVTWPGGLVYLSQASFVSLVEFRRGANPNTVGFCLAALGKSGCPAAPATARTPPTQPPQHARSPHNTAWPASPPR